MDQFVEQLRQVSPLSDEIVRQLLEEMKEVSFAKGELSIREGERDPFVWFVKTGLVRAFVEREGKDISLWFASDSEVIILFIGISPPIMFKWWRIRHY